MLRFSHNPLLALSSFEAIAVPLVVSGGVWVPSHSGYSALTVIGQVEQHLFVDHWYFLCPVTNTSRGHLSVHH